MCGGFSYCFCQFSDITSVVKSIRAMDDKRFANNTGPRLKMGFARSVPSSCVWVEGVADAISDRYLSKQFTLYGTVARDVVDRDRGHALIFFEQVKL